MPTQGESILEETTCSMFWKLTAIGWVAAAVVAMLTAQGIGRVVNNLKWQNVDTY